MSLRVDDLSHSYSAARSTDVRHVLQPQSWILEDGQQVLLRGISGSGKTTLFNILAGLLHPTGGAVFYDEQSLYAMPEPVRDRFRARHLGYIFQNHHLIQALTAIENVVMPIAFADVLPTTQWRVRAQELLEQMGIADHASYMPRQLSTGQRLRVAIARALANNPRVILADEPTAALDEKSSAVVMDRLQQTCRENNAILIIASHDPSLVERFSMVADLKNGCLLWNEWQPA